VHVLTVEQVLAMPVVRAAGPRVVAGAAGLDRSVRWVHSAELANISPLLRESDLLPSTGIAMPGAAPDLTRFAASLAESRIAGLVIELGRRWSTLPDALVDACEDHGLPLVSLAREVRFAAVTQSVGERIVASQLAELREAQRVHDTFTDLSISEAGPDEILEAVQRLAGAAVVLESDQHTVLDYRSGPGDISTFLEGWTSRSKRVRIEGRSGWDEDNGWLVTHVGKRDRGWGRLIVQLDSPPPERLIATAERAAAALALQRLHDRQRDTLVRRTHHELILGLLADPTSEDLLRRCELAGLPTARRHLVGLSLTARMDSATTVTAAAQLDDVIAATVHAAHELRVPALVCEIDRDVRALLSFAPSSNARRGVDALAARVGRRQRVTVGAGRPATRPVDISRTLREALHVVQTVRDSSSGPAVHRLEDVHLRGLLAMLGDDDRVRLFVDRELDLLRRHGEESGDGGLLEVLRALVSHPTSKSAAAASLHMSRPVFYDRLAKIESLLGVDLDDPDIRVSLHVALVAEEVSHRRG
jgi:PucR family transcriptional regulator, purine catabolism regulatory protein